MQTVVFLDLDDTLFQTLPKCPHGADLEPTAYGRDGSPLSYMTNSQRQLLQHLGHDGIVVPTTARNLDAFNRVRLEFTSFVILDFGGVVLREDRSLDPVWDQRVRPLAERAGRALERLLEQLQQYIDVHELGVRARVISDFELPLYLVMKHPHGDLDSLGQIQEQALPQYDLSEFFIHRNHNNLSLVPKYLGKEKAVRYLLDEHFDTKICSIGVGDSLSDARYMNLCDFCLMPSTSQLWRPMVVSHTQVTPYFSGSYQSDDVCFLLNRIELEPTPIEEKERLIQSGAKHYSEMIGAESLPSSLYLELFHEAMERHRERLARDVFRLAALIDRAHKRDIVLVSLARAGIPIGVILNRTLRKQFQRKCSHYSISIIRDRGIDENALTYLLQQHRDSEIVFVDGWTGKGVIAQELHGAITDYNRRHLVNLDSGLYVIADLCGWAKAAATAEDYLIPSSILGCTISGLISRSILNEEIVHEQEFHGCLYYEEYAEADLSQWFVDRVCGQIDQLDIADIDSVHPLSEDERIQLREQSLGFLERIQEEHGLTSRNHVKPGIGEATRVLLRRVPERIYVRDSSHADVAHLLWLAKTKGVPVMTEPTLPYHALALIKEMRS